MSLRDHFHPPQSRPGGRWGMVHGGWPMMISLALNRILPAGYQAGPRVYLGSRVGPGGAVEIDVAAYEVDDSLSSGDRAGGGAAVLAWAPPEPTLAVATDWPDLDVYEVRVLNTRDGDRLVAAVEIISPANKDRLEHRHAFVAKCAALVQARVSVVIVDVVTNRSGNLYAALLEQLGQVDPSPAGGVGSLYAASCRPAREAGYWTLQTWAYPLAVGRSLPTLPLWIAENLAVPLDLETSYEETCRGLRIP
jgi:hypothetical protein